MLDVGCGCGDLTIAAALAAGTGPGRALGVDLSAPMLLAGEYAARQRPGGVWVQAATWLITARRA